MKRLLSIITVIPCISIVTAQVDTSNLKVHNLNPITVEGTRIPQDIKRLEPIQGTYLNSGKKNEVIYLTQKNVTLAEKYNRQIFAKIPGVFVYDMDGTGNQVNISARGLDPHRGWEFNIRKDGVVTNTDMYGYPASHYNIPMEAVERIELVRGTGALQYGAQFGGMINYISKSPDTTKKISFENISTVGSYGLISTYNRISGKIGKFKYSGWFNKKKNDGYRKNNDSKYDAEAVSLFYNITKNIELKLEYTHSNYLIHLAGPLTDSMFRENPKMATRSRNYYEPDIHITSLAFNWNISKNTTLNIISSALLGKRSSVLFDKPANIPDTIVKETLQYNNRQVDIDYYESYTTEVRIKHDYKLLKQISTFIAGIQYMNNDLHRLQQGKGTTGSDYDLTLVKPGWGRDLHFRTNNIAIFVENRWMLTNRFSINTGTRTEIGESNLTGVITYYSEKDLPNTIKHRFPLFGINVQYDLTDDINVYAGWSQAYRPVILKDIVPLSVYEVTDKNLKDAKGYNAEIGFRGKWNYLTWDISGFYLQYNNRLGTLAQTDTSNNLIVFRTNIGNSRTIGAEIFLQTDFTLGKKFGLSLFTSTSYMDARYQNAIVKSGNENISIKGNKVESVPEWITRNGITLKYSLVTLSVLYNYTSETFADALNTVKPNKSGSVGIVPDYQIFDINLGVGFKDNIKILFSINNVFDERYFTKRPQFYPGPGIWPSDGRTISTSVFMRI